ncbi:MAG: glycosyltransferase family 4 protein, partial [Flavitalea sp.]
TVVNYPAIRQMQDKVKTIWWLQEAKVIDHFINEPEFVPTLINAKNIVGVSDYSLNMVRKYNNNFTKIYNACYDFYEPSKHDKDLSAKIRFTIVGSIESRKGHDILFQALDYLEQDVIDRLQIRVVGRVLDPAFRDMVTEKIRGKDFISFAGEIDNAGAVKEVAGSDVIVCPSRDDPFPVVLVEAFCMAKTCIVSDATGFAELIEDDETGFVFPSEDAKALAAAIRNIVLDPSKIERIGNNARSVYLRELSIPVLQRRLIAYMDEIPEPGETLSTSKDKTGSRKGTLVAEETA